MGRKHLPTNTKVAKRTIRPDRVNKDEPKPELKIPLMPRHLDIEASAEWDRMSKELHKLGLLSELDSTELAAYCVCYSRWVDAETQMAEKGIVNTTTNGNIIQSPLVGISNQSMILMHKFLTEFGMTPASRARVSAKKSNKKDDGWGDF